MDIEGIATSAVKAMIGRTARLGSFINERDKEPVWDGHIYIHEDSKKTKKNLKRVAVQVKGKVKSGTTPKRITYRVQQEDLTGYRYNGGAIFFVVYIDEKTGVAKQIYYSSLLPLKIMELQKKYGDKKPVPVSFFEYPEDSIEQTELFLNFYADSQRQASFAGTEPPAVEELMEKGLLEAITFNYTKVGKPIDELSLPKVFEGKSLSLYAKVKDVSVPIPVQYFDEICHVTTVMEQCGSVCVNDVCYYDHVKIVSTAESVSTVVGSVLTIIQPHDVDEDNPVRFHFKITGTLSERITAIRFLKALHENGAFTLADKTIPFEFSADLLERLHSSEWDELLEELTQIDYVLKALRVDKDLEIGKLNELGKNQLDMLVRTIGNGETLTGVHGEYPGVVIFSIANIKLLLFAARNEDDSCSLYDFFRMQCEINVEDKDGISHPTSQYVVLKKEHFLHVDNLDIDAVVDGLVHAPATAESSNQVNTAMLEMLLAYDEGGNSKLLSACKQISECLLRLKKVFPHEIAVINRLQITARERELNYAEKLQLHKLIGKTKDVFSKIGALILLGEVGEAGQRLNELPVEERESFLQFPIARFYNETQ